eukprot:CAMPEP_0202956380 /NCGR_PEP_ID=MMETSP1396-20130829/879_1 /ASSEMBLY_ACC=CAM_ASM_000872 /TAXON_ID= /ORGANISM="Pseudokeronopsis sp., Strain Brazil" /LENGTH=239 /DNA_ID=CAMNT_0049673351 /DNA_START=486 /DNA_END=1206 /DNA_ORIENTATION=-
MSPTGHRLGSGIDTGKKTERESTCTPDPTRSRSQAMANNLLVIVRPNESAFAGKSIVRDFVVNLRSILQADSICASHVIFTFRVLSTLFKFLLLGEADSFSAEESGVAVCVVLAESSETFSEASAFEAVLALAHKVQITNSPIRPSRHLEVRVRRAPIQATVTHHAFSAIFDVDLEKSHFVWLHALVGGVKSTLVVALVDGTLLSTAGGHRGVEAGTLAHDGQRNHDDQSHNSPKRSLV